MSETNDFQDALDHVSDVFTHKMPYLKPFNLTVDSFTHKKIVTQFDMGDQLVGNMVHGMLHGGVASTILDSVGGMIAIASAFYRLDDFSEPSRLACLAKVATIDLRVDYVRPGLGKHFVATASLIRAGNKIATVKSKLVNNEDRLIAIGQANYLIG